MKDFKIIDTHAHLFSSEIFNDSVDIIKRAKQGGVSAVLMPNIDIESIDIMIKMCSENQNFLYPMIGLHPCHIEDSFKSDLRIIEKHLANFKFIGIGEIGLDLFHDKTTLKKQKEALLIQLDWAKNLHLPISLHFREAFEEAYDIIKHNQNGKLSGVFHCFSGTDEEAQKIIDLGFYLGIGGVLTFKNSLLKETLKSVPLESIVLETDSPYLAPIPFRGKKNEPSFLIHVLDELQNIYNIDKNLIAEIIHNNTLKIFSLRNI